jgi:hypothetical protein
MHMWNVLLETANFAGESCDYEVTAGVRDQEVNIRLWTEMYCDKNILKWQDQELVGEVSSKEKFPCP